MLKFSNSCYTEMRLMVSFQFYYLFLNSSLKLAKLDLVLNFISSSEGEGKQLGISVATRSDFL